MRFLALAILGIGIVSNRDSLYRAGGRPDVRSGLSGLPARVRPDQLLRMPLTRRCLRATRRHQAARPSASSIHISGARKSPRAIGIAGSTRARFWNEPHRPQDRLHHARDPGGGNRLAGARIAVGRSIASQRVRGARWRGFVLIAQLLFSQIPEFLLPSDGSAGLLPKLISSCLDLLFASFGHYISPSWSTAPPSGVRGLIGGTVLGQLGD